MQPAPIADPANELEARVPTLPCEERARLTERLISSLDSEVDADSEELWVREVERRLDERSVAFHAEAESEFVAAALYCEGEAENLGLDFSSAGERTYLRPVSCPESGHPFRELVLIDRLGLLSADEFERYSAPLRERVEALRDVHE